MSKRLIPLPNIDELVDNLADYQLLSFMDAYSRYNQILMHSPNLPKDDEISFLEEIGEMLEMYMDDMIVKSSEDALNTQHLDQVFKRVR